MVPDAAIAFGQAITAPNWWYSHHLPPEMVGFLPKPLNTTIFGENDMKLVEFWSKWQPGGEITMKIHFA